MANLDAAKQELEQFSKQTTIHGCAELFTFSNAWRAFWLIIMVSVMGFCGSQLCFFVQEYAQDPRITAITFDHSMKMPFTLLRYRSLDWLNSSALSTIGPDPNVTSLLLQKYLFMPYYWPTACADEISEYDIYQKLKPRYPNTSPDQLVDKIRETKAGIYRTFRKFKENAQALYASLVRSDNNLNMAFAEYYLNNNLSTITFADIRYGTHGLSSEYKVSNFTLTKNAKIILTNAACTSDTDTVQLGIDSRMRQRDVSPTQTFQCARRYRISLKVATETHHPKYCDSTAHHLPLSCEARCMIRETRVAGDGCLPYFASPESRNDIPVCGLSKQGCRTKTRDLCSKKCEECKSCRPCKEVISEMTVTKLPQLHLGETRFTIVLYGKQRFKHYHTEPKHSFATLISGIGGIMGIGFGISIMSILQAGIHCAKFLKTMVKHSSLCAKEKDTSDLALEP